MTLKQENILNAALILFAEEGFKNTSTSKIAKQAAVSEGLIFRHFKNKDGLLNAIIAEGEKRFKLLYADIVLETNPKKVIFKIINLGKIISDNKEVLNFWKLQYKLKWELELYKAEVIRPLENALIFAFESLKYKDPKMEATLLLTLLDGMATRIFLDPNFNLNEVIESMQNKYHLK